MENRLSAEHNPEPIGECPVCQNTKFKKLFSKNQKDFWKCISCGLQKQHPLPTESILREYYELSYRSGMYETFSSEGDLKEMTAKQRLKEICRRIRPSGKWLDVGASTGVFVKTLLEGSINAEGIEISETAVSLAKENGLPVKAGTLETHLTDEKYDAITAFDLIEHLIDPITFLKTAHSKLKPDGYLIMTMPNLNSLSRYIMRSRWYFYIPEEHLHYFNPFIIRKLLERNNFNVLFVGTTYKPMTYNYAQTQFVEYNPMVYRFLNVASKLVPGFLRQQIIPLPIGEMMVVAQMNSL
ncbi:MAG: class I SAM-dependent methyltransferase [Acidobacteria bacterium]|nr:class I SAM-dependent methyltransferase [Acidobacteriota bacterium]